MKKLPLAVCLISGAEAHRIGRALASVADWAGEIIVVLNAEVADGTEEIARQHGAQIFRESWKGHIAQKNSAAAKAAQDWILGLDADEAISPELRAELETLFADTARLERMAAYDFPRLTRFGGRWIRHGDWYPDRQTRLWRRGRAQWGGIDPHDHLEVQGATGHLRSNLLHYTAESIDRQIAKITPFSAEFARHRRETGRGVSWLDLAVRPFWKFFRSYILRLGFLDGWQGYYIAWLNAFSVVTKYARLREPEQEQKARAMKLSLIVSTYNRPDALAKVLHGLQRQTHWPEEIFITDDGSDKPTQALIEEWRRGASAVVHHLWQPHDGFRKTIILNEALAKATGDYVVLLDGDCVPHRSFIADHAALAERGFWVQGRRCFVEERYVPEFEPGRTSVPGWMLAGRVTGATKGLRLPVPIVRRDKEQRGIIGCNMAYWRDDAVAINGYDEDYIGWGGEDSDLGSRLYHLGRPRKFVYGRAIVYHLNHPMLSRDNYPAGQARLQETIRSGKVRCTHGLDRHRK